MWILFKTQTKHPKYLICWQVFMSLWFSMAVCLELPIWEFFFGAGVGWYSFLYLLPFPMNSKFDQNHLLGEDCEKCNLCLYNRETERNLIWSCFWWLWNMHHQHSGAFENEFPFGGFDGFQIGCGFTMLHGAKDTCCLMVLPDITHSVIPSTFSSKQVLSPRFFLPGFHQLLLLFLIYFEITVHFKLDNLLIQKKKKKAS